jgi:hypothetical protein
MPPESRITRVAENHGCENGSHIRSEEVGTHTGYVAHVVAYVVGDSGRVARIIFRDAGFHLAHEVSAYVGSLRVDTPPTRANSAIDSAPTENPASTSSTRDITT